MVGHSENSFLCLALSLVMNATNNDFLLATCIDHTYIVLPCAVQLNLHTGKGHQIINCFIYSIIIVPSILLVLFNGIAQCML